MLSKSASRLGTRSKPVNWICASCKARLGASGASAIYPPSIVKSHIGLKRGSTLPLSAPRRNFSISSRLDKPSLESSANQSDPDPGIFLFDRKQFGDHGDVRNYLRDWSVRHAQMLKNNRPDTVVPGRNTVVPNSLFARENIVSQVDPESVEDAMAIDEQPLNQSEDDEVIDMTMGRTPLTPGDAFKMTKNKQVRSQMAVYLGSVGVQAQFLLQDGRWFMDTQIVYDHHKIKDFVSQDEISRIRSYLPVRPIEYTRSEDGGGKMPMHAFGEVPFNVCGHVLERFNKLMTDADVFKREYTQVVESTWERIAEEKTFKELTMEDFVSQNLGLDYNTLSDGARLELLDMLTEDERLSAFTVRASYIIIVMPKLFNKAVEQVTKWARSYQDAAAQAALGKDVSRELKTNPMTSFITKSRRLISKSRSMRSPTSVGLLSPTLSEIGRSKKTKSVELIPADEEFNEQDKTIVAFLWLNYLKSPNGRATRTRRNNAMAALILRAVGAYPKVELKKTVGRVFLQEIGCLPPWLQAYDHNVRLPTPVLGLNQQIVVLQERLKHYLDGLRQSQDYDYTRSNVDGEVEVLPEEKDYGGSYIYFPDSMADLRQDLGELPVFCIDKAGTKLVDDGISLEPATQDGQHWLHIHIAHGSAHIPVHSPLTDYAAYAVNNLYTSSGLHSCIPRCVTMPLSIKPGASTMTISTRLDDQGNVHETKIFASKVNNVVKIEPEYLYEHFPQESIPLKYELRVGYTPEPETFTDPEEERQIAQAQRKLMEEHHATFSKIKELLKARWVRRQIDNPEYLKGRGYGHSAYGHMIFGRENLIEAADGSFDRLLKPHYYLGDPGIYLWTEVPTVAQSYEDQPSKYDIVSGCMLMVCESVGRWSSQRDVPVTYNTHYFDKQFPMSKINNLGPHDFHIAPQQAESLEPARHYLLNCEHYVRLTSPLRRWKDLMYQYQIDAYLRAEAAARSAKTDHDEVAITPHYPYSRDNIRSYIEAEAAYSMLSMFKKSERDHWRFMTLFRAFYFQEAKLPDVWEVQHLAQVHLGMHETDSKHYYASLLPFNWKADFVESPEGYEKQAKLRDFQRVTIEYIDIDKVTVFVKAIAGPTKEPTIGRDPVFVPRYEEAGLKD